MVIMVKVIAKKPPLFVYNTILRGEIVLIAVSEMESWYLNAHVVHNETHVF